MFHERGLFCQLSVPGKTWDGQRRLAQGEAAKRAKEEVQVYSYISPSAISCPFSPEMTKDDDLLARSKS
jgi:hypothetical protein